MGLIIFVKLHVTDRLNEKKKMYRDGDKSHHTCTIITTNIFSNFFTRDKSFITPYRPSNRMMNMRGEQDVARSKGRKGCYVTVDGIPRFAGDFPFMSVLL
jgi:hypothetical protein